MGFVRVRNQLVENGRRRFHATEQNVALQPFR